MDSSVIGISLAAHPHSASHLYSCNGALVAWNYSDKILCNHNGWYHFALHVPAIGWRAYRWNEAYGAPVQILPVSNNAVWARTTSYNIIRLCIGENDEATIAANIEADRLLYADERSCWIREGNVITHLFFEMDGAVKVIDMFCADATEEWGYSYHDGAVVVGGHYSATVFTASNQISYTEHTGLHFYPPFVVRYDRDCIYYTKDLRRDWHSADVRAAYYNRFGIMGVPIFLGELDGTCYALVQNSDTGIHNIWMCKFPDSGASASDVRHVWQIQTAQEFFARSVAIYRGMICIASRSPIIANDHSYMPRNDGFLVWNPKNNSFYTDLPQHLSVPKSFIRQSPHVRIPPIWINTKDMGK